MVHGGRKHLEFRDSIGGIEGVGKGENRSWNFSGLLMMGISSGKELKEEEEDRQKEDDLIFSF